ncbi:MAG TPA: nitroreductase/quinone reductase family protein [Candidatus Sulfotelmatobacter sp.]|nr:nitroreductase/quinone reductase family protein [Candidatus Sulfotelmatobacter sp.]
MPAQNDTLKKHLVHASEITITVKGRKSGRSISNPIWFVFEQDTLCLLPVHGSETQWYKNVLKNPSIHIDAGGTTAALKAQPVGDAAQVKSVVEKFRAKYGPGDVKKYYSKLDVAIVVQIH